MLRKGLAVAVILLFIGVAFIPNVSAHDKEINDNKAEPLDIGRTILSGTGLFPFFWGDYFIFFARMCHYMIITGTSRTTGTFRCRWVTIPKDFLGYYKIGPFNIYIIYFPIWFSDGFEPPDNIMRTNNQMRILS